MRKKRGGCPNIKNYLSEVFGLTPSIPPISSFLHSVNYCLGHFFPLLLQVFADKSRNFIPFACIRVYWRINLFLIDLWIWNSEK